MVNRERTRTREIHARLERAWTPFFTRFGRLTPIQVETIPLVLDGKNVVVCSPTASGKTIAVLAPVAELHRVHRWPGLAVLYVVPTRALANDVYDRIHGPLADMGITVEIKHGDKPYLSKNLPGILVTTPESFDSLLCRRPRVFTHLQVVILDEIHFLDNTYRGDQLRVLLERLGELVDDFPRVHLLSATLPDPAGLGGRYITTGPFEVVNRGQSREPALHLVDSHAAVKKLVRHHRWKKVLYFCNYRQSVERVARELRPVWEPYPVLAHHGNLSRAIREDAERTILSHPVAVIVATSTLEVGIDIGDIDLVVLAEIPWTLSSLVQRIGRGSRREAVINVAAYAGTPGEAENIKALFTHIRHWADEVEPYAPDLSVVVQQVFSILFQKTRGVATGDLVPLLETLAPARVVRAILHHLGREGFVEYRGNRWYASEATMNEAEKGQIHSNIPDTRDLRVVAAASGREVGKISGNFDHLFLLAGRMWQVVGRQKDAVVVVPAKKAGATPPKFEVTRKRGKFHRYLPPDLRGKG